MVNKKLYKGLSKLVIALMIVSSSVSGVAHAATGDIINTTNQKMYSITSSNDIKALIADLKDGGGDVFLKENSNDKYYNPNNILTAQSAEIIKLLKAANVSLTEPTAIKTYIKNNAVSIMADVKVETDKVANQTVDTSNYKTPTVANLTVSSASAINATANAGDSYTLPTTVVATLSDGTSKELAVTWDNVVSTTVAGTYTFAGTLTMVDGVVNTNNVNVQATLIIASDIGDNTDITNKFTDTNFKAAVYSLIGKNGSAKILYSDVKNLALVNVQDDDISSLSGIEYFIALKILWCNSNQLTTLDVSKNAELGFLFSQYNDLTTLDLSKNTTLSLLDCTYNRLMDLYSIRDTWNIAGYKSQYTDASHTTTNRLVITIKN
ncbi:Ig-like domain-containing protein [Clostridium sp. DSM 17811]|uniref:Ig-like domain-containing protein n=1 Tax=Clostridium sp. DSM 17811 TaxID=2843317 RepID=UPI001C0B553D|nr:Ig-like domain-containing protein [Clostridium sp. DSM 17811]MBU3101779.1 Ig-like domain-containing protein [Clostridium sp. DSM 17811]